MLASAFAAAAATIAIGSPYNPAKKKFVKSKGMNQMNAITKASIMTATVMITAFFFLLSILYLRDKPLTS
jgi:hypothetical protein